MVQSYRNMVPGIDQHESFSRSYHNLASALPSFSSISNFSAQRCSSCFFSTYFPSATISANFACSSASLDFNELEVKPYVDLLCLLDFDLIDFPDFLSTSASLSQFLPLCLKEKIFASKFSSQLSNSWRLKSSPSNKQFFTQQK